MEDISTVYPGIKVLVFMTSVEIGTYQFSKLTRAAWDALYSDSMDRPDSKR